MIEQLKEILIPYLPTLMSSGMACIVAMFLKKANASSLVLKTDKREILDRVDKVAEQTYITRNALHDENTKNLLQVGILREEVRSTLELFTDALKENQTLHEQLEQIKKELVELKATVRKKED